MTIENRNDSFLKGIPKETKSIVLSMLEKDQSFRERWELAKKKAVVTAEIRMVIADFLIREGLMKRRF